VLTALRAKIGAAASAEQASQGMAPEAHRPAGIVAPMFEPVGAFDLVALENAVLARWRDDDVFGESLRQRHGAPEWIFYEGPPTANNKPGIHHVWARLFKDIYPRYHTMQGKHVARKGGWDCHGLPVEVEIEKELGFSGKHEIEDYGIERFNAKCRASVQRYVEDWQSLTSRIGMWLDTAGAYWTLSNDYIESVWWLFRQMWDGGAIYEGFKVVPYCGRCGTALSSHELGQPGAYRDITEPSVYVRFPLVDGDADLVVWTTTPWTLPSNVAAAVGPEVAYVRAKSPEGGRDLILARDRVAAVLGDDAEVIGPVPVSDLVGQRYEPPFTLVPVDGDRAFTVVADEFVTVEDGSGIVHLAPAFGEIDREVGEREGLPIVNPVNDAARFVDKMGAPYAGKFVKDADPALVDDLAARGRLLKVVDYTHSYPHCWRCGTPLIYWAKPTWFARTSSYKDAMLRENETINWYPETIKHGRFGDWLENNVDWALSRDRYWGTPIPVWRCHDCSQDTCVGSIAELSELSGRELTGMDPHRPYVDDITIDCPSCEKGTAYRVEPVLDAWFDSGSMPAAQLHYPFENEDTFGDRFPADFICEAIDQTRGWFYSLLAVNTLVFGKTPYRNVVCLAHIIDESGLKMSKSRGNVIDPWSVLDTRGAEALRWYMFSSGSPWTTKRVSVEGIDESTRQFLLTLWNTYSFFVTYANIDGWSPAPAPATHVLDRWVRSRLHRTIRVVTDALESFDAYAGAQALTELVDDVSNWYVRRSRPRFWKSSDPAAHATLHEVLRTIVLLLAPYTPFLADEMYRNLASTESSVHLADWPAVDDAAIDDPLEAEMGLARTVVSLGRAARADAKLGVRQPLPRAIALLTSGESMRDEIVAEIAEELNVKKFEVVASLEGLLSYRVVPNFKALGPRLGGKLPRVKELLASVDGSEVKRAFDEAGRYELAVDGDAVVLEPADVEIRAEQHEELSLAQDGPHAVALDLTLDDDLRAEGLARETIRTINDLRKSEGFALADRITVRFEAGARLVAAVTRHRNWIASEVLATEFDVVDTETVAAPNAMIDGEPVQIKLARA
jgi:isoleucyl-tRNA synthetase